MELFKLFGTIFVDDSQAKKAIHETTQESDKASSKMSDSFKKIGGNLTDVGKSMTTKVTAPLAGIGLAAGKLGVDFGSSMSAVQAVTSASGDEMEKLRGQARELGKDTQFSAKEAAEGMEMLGRAGFSTQEIYETMPGMLDLAASGAVDLGTAADVTSNILSGFGLEASEAGRLSDVLAQSAASSNTDVVGLGEAFKYVGPVASSLGLSVEDTAASIGILGDAGIAGGQAGNTLKRGLLNLSAPSEKAGKLMDDLGINVFDAEGNMKSMPEVIGELENGLEGMTAQQKTATLETLFGSEAVSGWSALIDAGGENLGEFSNELENSEGAAARMAEVMNDNLGGRLKEMQSALEEVALVIFESLQPAFEKVVEWVTKAAEIFQSLSPEMQTFIVVIGGIAAAIGPVLIVVGTMISTFGKIAPLFTAIKTVAGVLGTAIAGISAPVLIAVGVITGLIAIGVALYKNWDTVKEYASKTWGWIKDFFSKTLEFIGDLFKTIWGGIEDLTKLVWDGIKLYFTTLFKVYETIFTTVFNAIKKVVEVIWEGIKKVTSVIWDGIKAYFTTLFSIYEKLFTTVFNAIKKVVEVVWNAIKGATETVWNAIKGYLENLFNFYKNLFTTVFNALKTTIETVWNAVKSVTETVWNAIKSFITNLINGIKNTITSVWNAIKSSITTIINAIRATITSVWNAIKTVTSSVFNSIKSVMTNIWNGIKSTVSNVVNSIKNTMTNTWNTIKNTTTRIFDSVKSAITKPVEAARDAVKKAVDAIFGFFKNLKIPEIKIPKIKLPKFSIKGSFSLNPPKVPSLGVNWYKTGGIATDDSIVGIGEAGDEAVLPLEGKYLKPWASEMSKQLIEQGGSPRRPNSNDSGGNTTVIIELDGKKIAEGTVPHIPDVVRMKTGIKQ